MVTNSWGSAEQQIMIEKKKSSIFLNIFGTNTAFRVKIWNQKLTIIVGFMDQESSQQLQMWFSEHFFAPKLAGLFVTPIVSSTVEQIWREKMSEKPHSIRLLRWLNFSQSGSRKNNRKTFEGASVEPKINPYTKF